MKDLEFFREFHAALKSWEEWKSISCQGNETYQQECGRLAFKFIRRTSFLSALYCTPFLLDKRHSAVLLKLTFKVCGPRNYQMFPVGQTSLKLDKFYLGYTRLLLGAH